MIRNEMPLLCAGIYSSHPPGYRPVSVVPLLCGENHCLHCLCTPCIVVSPSPPPPPPPRFLVWIMWSPSRKCREVISLYHLFGGLLRDFSVLNDQEYIQRKEERTVRDDRWDIIPTCIIKVSVHVTPKVVLVLLVS